MPKKAPPKKGKKVRTLPARKATAKVKGGSTGGRPVARYYLENAWPTK